MKILMVGGTGCLSSAVVKEALKQNIEVFVLNRGNRLGLIPNNAKLLKTDVKNSEEVKSLLGNTIYDAVIDFICSDDKDVEYSFNLFKNNTKQYVFISSCAVYNSLECNNCDENAPKILNIWNYSVGKDKAENWLKENAVKTGIPYTIVRPAVTYGDTRIPYGITPPYGMHWTLIERIKHGKPIITWNNGENYCNITHVSDFAIAFVGLLKNENAYNEAFNIVGDETPKWKDVLTAIENCIGIKVKTFDIPSEFYAKEIPNRKGEILGGRSISVKCRNEKIKSIVPQFKQTISLEEGVKLTLEYYKAHNYIDGIDYAFDGNSDRIIAKYAKINSMPIKEFNLEFIDYLGNNRQKDKRTYLLERNKDNFIVKCLNFSKHVLRKVK
jgi:nucleoside-diphosphate-sugar epimerase